MLLVLLGILLVAACKKEDDEDPEPEDCNVVYITQKITENTTFKRGNVYIIDINGDFQIEATLTIEPGVVIKSLKSYQRYLVHEQGKLLAQGTVEKPIIFTSQYDNAHGCDMSGDGTPPAPGDWGLIQFVEVEGSVLSHCQLYYGGGWLLATVEVIRSSVEISH